MNHQDLLAYTISNAGTLHCFLRDLWALRKECLNGDFIFWLNEVPCVSITFVGVVVGINSYDDNTLIWVDDGSAVVKAKLPHIRIPHVQETKSKEGKSIKKEEMKIYGPPNGLPLVGNTVKVFAKLENGWQNQEQPVNIRIKDFLVCGNMEEVFHWTRVIELHKTKYSQPFVLPAASSTPLPPVSVPSTPQKVQAILNDQSTPKATQSFASPASSIPAKSSLPPTPNRAMVSTRIPRLRHPSRLRSSQMSLETLQTYTLYYMNCMMENIEPPGFRDDTTPTKRLPPRSRTRNTSENDSRSELKPCAGFGLGYLMRVPELQSLAIRVIKAELKSAEKRKILQERDNLQRGGSIKPPERSSRSKKLDQPSSLKKGVKLLFERVISNLFHNGAIVIEEGESRKWDNDEGQLMNSLQLWKHKTDETQSQFGESTILSEVSLASTAGTDELELSDIDESDDAYIPVTPHVLYEPVISAMQYGCYGKRQANARTKRQGTSEEDILRHLKNIDSRWDHISSIAVTMQRLEEEEVIWEVSRGVWALH